MGVKFVKILEEKNLIRIDWKYYEGRDVFEVGLSVQKGFIDTVGGSQGILCI